MIIEMPILILVCIWLLERTYFNGRPPKETSLAFSVNIIAAHIINLVWLALFYPHLNIKIDDYFVLFFCVYILFVFLTLIRCETNIFYYFFSSLFLYILLRIFILIESKIEYAVYVAALELNIPLFWLLTFRWCGMLRNFKRP